MATDQFRNSNAFAAPGNIAAEPKSVDRRRRRDDVGDRRSLISDGSEKCVIPFRDPVALTSWFESNGAAARLVTSHGTGVVGRRVDPI